MVRGKVADACQSLQVKRFSQVAADIGDYLLDASLVFCSEIESGHRIIVSAPDAFDQTVSPPASIPGYNNHPMFLPTTRDEMKKLGWDELDIILVTGDSYIDSPFIGTAVIGKLLARAGYLVGVIAQPALEDDTDISRLGLPRLFWGVTAGSVDSMVANYTALKKKRNSDDYTPGGVNNRRPDRATIAYTNLIHRFANRQPDRAAAQRPVVLGGIEASLRRVAHYDFWTDRVRGSVLLDAKADYLLYGMAEKSVVELANGLRDGSDVRSIRGLCYIASQPREGYSELASVEEVSQDKRAFIAMFHTFYQNNDPLTAKGLCQKHGKRYLIQNPPALYLDEAEMDAAADIRYEREQHPYYQKQGSVRALDTIRFSIATHRGCYGECNYCAIAVHEGRTVRSRSQGSILREAEELTRHVKFKGVIQDVGGPTANMYGYECAKKQRAGACPKKRCLYPAVCPVLKANHHPQMDLLKKIRRLDGVKKVFVASGIRYDLLFSDQQNGATYLKELVKHHVSGQLKVAPEHSEEKVLKNMGKPGTRDLLRFKESFEHISKEAHLQQYLTYYLIAAHPGCTEEDMERLKKFTGSQLALNPEQVQIFTPTPSTYSSLMYYTEMDPFTLRPVFVEKNPQRKARQKDLLTHKKRA